jgi:hypothetical protein
LAATIPKCTAPAPQISSFISSEDISTSRAALPASWFSLNLLCQIIL